MSSKTGSLNLLPGHNYLTQAGHMDFEHTRQENMGLWFSLAKAEATLSWMCLSSQRFVHY